jgi:hypothetical protein
VYVVAEEARGKRSAPISASSAKALTKRRATVFPPELIVRISTA